MKFRAEVYAGDTAWGDTPDEVEVTIGDHWREKFPIIQDLLEEHKLHSATATYEGDFQFFLDGELFFPQERIGGCHIKIMDGHWFRFVFPFRDGPGHYADTDLLQLDDEI